MDGGELLRGRIDEMRTSTYQSLFGAGEGRPWRRLLDGLDGSDGAARPGLCRVRRELVADPGTSEATTSPTSCRPLAEARRSVTAGLPFRIPIKGFDWRSPAGRLNHSALLTEEADRGIRAVCGLAPETEWTLSRRSRPRGSSARGRRADRAAALPAVRRWRYRRRWSSSERRRSRRRPRSSDPPRPLARTGTGGEIVTVSPDVSISTNLGG